MEVGKKTPNLRGQMPETAKWVDEQRAKYGAEHVNSCIKAALAGVAGKFYAMEAGQILGTPFPATHPVADDQKFALMIGSPFAAFIETPRKA